MILKTLISPLRALIRLYRSPILRAPIRPFRSPYQALIRPFGAPFKDLTGPLIRPFTYPYQGPYKVLD